MRTCPQYDRLPTLLAKNSQQDIGSPRCKAPFDMSITPEEEEILLNIDLEQYSSNVEKRQRIS